MSELVLVSARDDASLATEVARLIAFIDRVPDVSLLDVAYTCSLMRGSAVLSLVVDSVAELRARLFSAKGRIEAGATRVRDKSGTYYFRDHMLGDGKGKLAFVYPGVTGFYPDMMRDLAIEYAPCRDSFDILEEALSGNEAFSPSSFIFPPAPYYRRDADIYSSGAYAQALVATYSACTALTRLLYESGVRPDGVVGFAGGDLAAFVSSGVAGESPSRPDRVKIIRDIYNIVDKAVNHGGLPKMAMVSVLFRSTEGIDELEKTFPPEKVMLVVDFSPRQRTYAIAEDYESIALSTFSAAGARVMKLALDRPFNTILAKSLVPAIRKFAQTWMKTKSICEVYSCTTGERLAGGLKAAREDTANRWARPVLFGATIRRMFADGYRVFLEVGPRGLLTAAISETLKGETCAAVAMNSIHRSGRLQLQHAVGQLVALGATMDISSFFVARHAKRLDFDAALSLEVRRDSEMRLSRAFPRLTFLSRETALSAAHFMAEPKGRGVKARERAAAIAQQARRQRQFDFGAMNPLVSDADILNQVPGVSVELTKVFRISELPFIGDCALGTSQISYSDPNIRGLVPLTMPVGAEIMGEAASLVVPNRTLIRIEDFVCRRMVSFRDGDLKLFIRAERIAASAPSEIAVKVQIRDDSPNSAYTWPVMEASFVLSEFVSRPKPLVIEPHVKPRSVHWSGRDIYPVRLCAGRRLRGVTFVDAWSETGLDYEIVVPPLAGNVVVTRFPVWVVNPLLLSVVVSGFALWRSHERFAGAFSFPFRMRRMTFAGMVPPEGSNLKCYLRLTGVTPKSHLCEVAVTDGNGVELARVSGWEELSERVPIEYRDFVLQPALSFLTETLSAETIGYPATDVSSAFVTDVPYAIFERNEELWLRIFSHIALCGDERRDFREMTGSTSRRTEWLFGRLAAKEAVRRFLKDYYQARWSDADIQIWPDDSGKPHALGAWSEFLTTKLDIAIAHTSQFVIAIAAANSRVGVDVESTARDLSEEFTSGVFTPEELELAAGAVKSAHAIIRFWCAKEAVSKALGTGIRYSPKEMVIADYRSDTGALKMRLEGAWFEAFKVFKGRYIDVTVKTVRDHALATCFIPASFFED